MTKTWKFVDYADIFQKFFKKYHHHFEVEMFRISVTFLPAVVVSYLQIQQKKNSLNYISFTKPYRCSIQILKAGCGNYERCCRFS